MEPETKPTQYSDNNGDGWGEDQTGKDGDPTGGAGSSGSSSGAPDITSTTSTMPTPFNPNSDPYSDALKRAGMFGKG
jgi:hypothetical protein